MKNNEEYNGWCNYETWATNLHLDEFFRDVVEEHVQLIVKNNEDIDDKEPVSIYTVAELLQTNFEELFLEPENLDGLMRDLLRDDKINWWDIASHILSDVLDNVSENERPEVE